MYNSDSRILQLREVVFDDGDTIVTGKNMFDLIFYFLFLKNKNIEKYVFKKKNIFIFI